MRGCVLRLLYFVIIFVSSAASAISPLCCLTPVLVMMPMLGVADNLMRLLRAAAISPLEVLLGPFIGSFGEGMHGRVG